MTKDTLSLLIPIYNEERNIEKFCENLSQINWTIPCEWIFVDDFSKDRSYELLNTWLEKNKSTLSQKQVSFKVEKQPKNFGKGAAVHRAIELASGTISIVQDADFEYDPREIPMLIQPIVERKADVVYGSRFKKSGLQVHRTYHYFINRFLTLMSNLLSGLYLTDMETCYKACKSDIFKNLKLHSPRFGFEVEVTSHLARLRVRVLEIPVNYFPRNYMEGKKISWKDGVAAVWHILYFNVFMKESERFSKTLPEHYRVSGANWL